jgi:predicted dehydrogenase
MTNTDQKIGVALIGAGLIGKTHVSALNAMSGQVALRAIVSNRPERAHYLADFYDGTEPVFTSDLSVVTDNPEIQMVIVATPPSVRIELIQTLAKAGKHILLEKPVARNLAEATQVVKICADAGVTLGMVFQHRMRPASKSALEHMNSGDLGALGHVEIAAPLWRDQSYYDELGRGTYERDGGGVMLTQAIHTIDLALSLTGAVTGVQAMTATTPLHQMEAEDFAIAGLKFADGAVGSFVTSTASFPQGPETIHLHFEQASLLLSKHHVTLLWRDGRKDFHDFTPQTDDDTGAVVNNFDLHQGVIQDFVDAITLGHDPIVTGEQGLVSHRFIDAIEASSRTGQRVEVER